MLSAFALLFGAIESRVISSVQFSEDGLSDGHFEASEGEAAA